MLTDRIAAQLSHRAFHPLSNKRLQKHPYGNVIIDRTVEDFTSVFIMSQSRHQQIPTDD